MYLGLDLGTSGIKALLINENNSFIGSADASYKVKYPQKGWSEQSPKDWKFAFKKVFAINLKRSFVLLPHLLILLETLYLIFLQLHQDL